MDKTGEWNKAVEAARTLRVYCKKHYYVECHLCPIFNKQNGMCETETAVEPKHWSIRRKAGA